MTTDQPDTPDLRTLAAEALALTLNGPASDGRGWYRNAPERVECFKRADAVLAAVLPAHRRQVLDEAEREVRHRADSVPWSDPTLRRGIQYAAATVAMLARDSAATDPQTGPAPRPWETRAAATGGGPCPDCGRPFWTHVCLGCSPDHQTPGPGCINCRGTGMDQTPCKPSRTTPTSTLPVETGPAVGREAAQAQGAAEAVVPDEVESLPSFGRPVGRRRLMPAAVPDGPRTWALPDEPGPEVTAVRNAAGGTWDREGDGWRYRTSGRVPGVVGSWRRWDGLLITEGTLTDATPADGQDGDGHG